MFRFNSEEARLLHPLASQISKKVWEFCEYASTPDTELQHYSATMQAPVPLVKQYLSEHYHAKPGSFEESRLWLAIVVSHSNAGPKELLYIARIVKLYEGRLFTAIVFSGRIDIFEEFAKRIKVSSLQDMIKSKKYKSLRDAELIGDWKMLRKLLQIMPLPNDKEKLTDVFYQLLQFAIKNGDRTLIDLLIAIVKPFCEHNFLPLVTAESFVTMAENGMLDERLLNDIGDRHLPLLITHNNCLKYSMFGPYLPVSKNRHDAAYLNFSPFLAAVSEGKIQVMSLLLQYVPAEFRDEMLYQGWLRATTERYITITGKIYPYVISLLMDAMDTKFLEEVLKCHDYQCLKLAMKYNLTPLINRMLCLPSVYVHALTHEIRLISEFTTNKINQFIERSKAISSNKVFNLNEEETRLCYYIIANLISQNDIAYQDGLRFLLNIPSVQSLVHIDLKVGYPNGLMHIALENGNQDAISILSDILVAKESAEIHRFSVFKNTEAENNIGSVESNRYHYLGLFKSSC